MSYPAPQSSLTAVGPTFVSSMKDSHTLPFFFLAHKCVIHRLKGSLSTQFDDVPELNVKCCFYFIAIPLDHILHLSFLIVYIPDILKVTIIKCVFKKRAIFYAVLFYYTKKIVSYLIYSCK